MGRWAEEITRRILDLRIGRLNQSFTALNSNIPEYHATVRIKIEFIAADRGKEAMEAAFPPAA